MNQALIQRGALNVRDAAYVRRVFVPSAIQARRWNIAVFECFCSLELLVKGMWCLSGHCPRQSHEIDVLVQGLADLQNRTSQASPFLAAALNQSGDGYLLHSDGLEITLLRRSGELYTVLGGVSGPLFTSIDRLLDLDLVVGGSCVQLTQDGVPLISVSESVPIDLGGTVHTRFRVPDRAAVLVLKSAASKLRESRESAYFATSECDQGEALAARAAMEEAWEAASSFIIGNAG